VWPEKIQHKEKSHTKPPQLVSEIHPIPVKWFHRFSFMALPRVVYNRPPHCFNLFNQSLQLSHEQTGILTHYVHKRCSTRFSSQYHKNRVLCNVSPHFVRLIFNHALSRISELAMYTDRPTKLSQI
jgi:hypothetical protein